MTWIYAQVLKLILATIVLYIVRQEDLSLSRRRDQNNGSRLCLSGSLNTI